MTAYYKIGHRIVKFDEALNEQDFNHTRLTDEQVSFYLANPNASVQEILNMQLNAPVEPEPYVAMPTAEERIEDLENVLNLMIAGEL